MKFDSAKVLILGAEGFVGSHIADRIPEARRLDDRSLPKHRFENTIVKSITEPLDDEIRGMDLVIHAACRDIRHSMSEPLEDARVNVLGTLNVLATCRRHRVPFFYISSVSVTSEASHYGISKSAGERYTQLYRQWIPTCMVRLSNVFGPRDTESVLAKWLRADRIMLIDANATRDFTYIQDTLDGIFGAIEHWPSETVDIGTGIESSLGEVAEWLARRLDKRIEKLPIREIDNVRHRVTDPALAEELIGFKAKWKLHAGLEECIRAFHAI